MTNVNRTPLDPATGGRMPEAVPVEGVPDFLAPILWSWLEDGFPSLNFPQSVNSALDDLALFLRINLGDRGTIHRRLKALEIKVREDRVLFLKAVDWALDFKSGARSRELSSILERAGSAWTVAPDQRALVRRVLPEAYAAAAQVVESGTNAGTLIAQAWRLTYGREPNPTAGFDKAVRAVEAVACPVIVPNDKSATLGRAIGILKKRPPEKYITVFRNSRETDPLDAVVALMQLVWTNNYARHASDPSVPLDTSQQEAEAALHAAVTLVQWFQRGYIGEEPS